MENVKKGIMKRGWIFVGCVEENEADVLSGVWCMLTTIRVQIEHQHHQHQHHHHHHHHQGGRNYRDIKYIICFACFLLNCISLEVIQEKHISLCRASLFHSEWKSKLASIGLKISAKKPKSSDRVWQSSLKIDNISHIAQALERSK